MNACLPISKSQTGFSLLELMIVLAITSILLTIALPNYHHYIQHAHRHSALTDILYLQLLEENYYRDHGRYASEEQLGASLPKNRYYEFSVQTNTAQHYKIFAQAKTMVPNCNDLSIDDKNQKSPEGCWKT